MQKRADPNSTQIPKPCGSELQLALLSAQSDTLSQVQELDNLQVPKFLCRGQGPLRLAAMVGHALQIQLPGDRMRDKVT